MAIVLITGAAKRLGATTAKYFHQQGFTVVVHYGQSQAQAETLVAELNQLRDQSAFALAADLNQVEQIPVLIQRVEEICTHNGLPLKVLVNNASTFFPTPVNQADLNQWDQLFNANLKAPFFLVQQCLPLLKKAQGSVVNLVDIHGIRPLQNHSLYSSAKAGLIMMTKALALELAPEIRVNGVAPGAILWPEGGGEDEEILATIPLATTGVPLDIAKAIYYLAVESNYVTGQILPVDGGRTLKQ